MSLLIKGLQKAGRSKTVANEGAAPALTLPPDILDDDIHTFSEALSAESGFDDVAPAPNATQKIETGAHDLSKTLAQHRSPQAAANVLKAKEDPVVIKDPGQRAFWLAVLGLAILLLAGGGFYYYLEALQQPTVVLAPRLPTTPAQTAAASAAVNQQSQAATAPPPVVLPSPPVPQAPAAVTTDASPGMTDSPPSAPATAIPEKSPDGVYMVAAMPSGEKSSKAEPGKGAGTAVQRNHISGPNTDATVISAYQALIAGDDATAERLYRQVQRSEHRNVDVLLGLAAIATRQGKAEEAEQHYMQVLDMEPRNAAAQAGLIGLMGLADPVTSASRLRTLLVQQPDTAFLHEALGNLYSEQGQWPAAQQSYFQAFQFEPSTAEYAFNLAVSLDQLNKPDLALNYYQRAQELQPDGGATLNKSQLETRISQLRLVLSK